VQAIGARWDPNCPTAATADVIHRGLKHPVRSTDKVGLPGTTVSVDRFPLRFDIVAEDVSRAWVGGQVFGAAAAAAGDHGSRHQAGAGLEKLSALEAGVVGRVHGIDGGGDWWMVYQAGPRDNAGVRP
jgi:hypothetical protein